MSALSAETKLHIALSYAQGKPTKIIAYDFGVCSKTISRIVSSAGIKFRHRNSIRNEMTASMETKAAELFKGGSDTLTIARLLCVKECKVANALARGRDRERAA